MKKQYYMLLISCFLLAACTKVEVVEPDFEVTTTASTYKVNEEVVFNFTGDPDQLVFYSGEVLNDYAFKDGRILESSGLTASFSSHVAYGTHPDLLSVWVSTDFNGKYTIEDVHAATWKDDITKTFTLAPHSMSNTAASSAVPSGVKDITPHLEEGKPIYFAFRYKKRPDTDPLGGGQRNWFVRSFSINSSTILGSQEIANGLSLNLVYDRNFDANPADKNSVINAAGVLTIRVPSTLGAFHTEVWAITSGINVGKVDLGPDAGKPVKGFVEAKSADYKHIYTKPGIYKVTFVASNANIYGAKQVVRQVDIEIVE